MMYIGDVAAGATVRFMWNTSGADGSSITRATNGTIRIYKDSSDTERSSAAGITDTEDMDTLTGVHRCVVDLSDNTDAGFYAAGHEYFAVLAAATIDGKTVNAFLAQWSIDNRVPKVDVQRWAGTAVATPNTAGVPVVDLRTFTRVGTAQAGGASNEIILDAGASAIDNYYAGQWVTIISGIGAGQSGQIDSYTGSNKHAVVSPPAAWKTNPNATSVFVIWGFNGVTSTSVGLDGVYMDLSARIPPALISGRMDSSVGAMAAGVLTASAIATGALTAAKFASGALDAVWSTATRLLTAGTNIVLAKGTGLTGLNDLSAAQVNAEADTALADVGVTATVTGRIDVAVSSRLATAGYTAPDNADVVTILGLVDTEVAAVKAKTDLIPASPAAVGDVPTANANADALLDRAAGVETGWTLRQAMRIMLAAIAGKADGAATATMHYRDMADSKNRITATVSSDGDRTAVARDAS